MNKTSLLICALIFLLSIFLRSQIDIGPDTGIYLDLGKKVVEGKRYYYDFFESNFPISFYFYALEYRLSTLLHINPIILSDIIINLLALLSIFWSARILRRGGIKSDLIIIGFFLGFFLRVRGLSLGEFGTKTSLLLLLLFPYISYSLVSEKIFTKRDLIWRGCLMGLMPCVKPHYLIFLLVIESYKFWQTKSPQFFLELDKLLAAAIYLGYLVWIIWFLPEFFEFMVPMWGKAYASYDSLDVFWGRCLRILASHVLLMGFVLLIFSRIRPSHESKILILFFVAASLLFVVENAITIDQSVIFYAVVTVCILRFVADLLASKKIILAENKFIFGALFLIPAFDLKALPTAVFGLAGFVNIWWVLALFVLPKIERKVIFLLVYFLCLSLVVLSLKHGDGWDYITFNLAALFAALFFYEKKIHAKISERFSTFSVFVIASALSSFFYFYVDDAAKILQREKEIMPDKMTDMVNYYSKQFAPNKEDGLMMMAVWNYFIFPRLNYLDKDNHQKFYTASILADYGEAKSLLMFPIHNKDSIFTVTYLFDDIKKSLRDPRTKVVFVNNSTKDLIKKNRCLVSSLEYYLFDYEFRKNFFKNFRFENRVIIDQEVKVLKNVPLLTGVAPSVFDQVKKSNRQVWYDFEVYVRK